MPYGITQVLPATQQRWEPRLYPQPKQVLDLATPEGCKAELTYVTRKPPAGNWPVNRKSIALPLSHHATYVWKGEAIVQILYMGRLYQMLTFDGWQTDILNCEASSYPWNGWN